MNEVEENKDVVEEITGDSPEVADSVEAEGSPQEGVEEKTKKASKKDKKKKKKKDKKSKKAKKGKKGKK